MALTFPIGLYTFVRKHRRLIYTLALLVMAALVISLFSDGLQRAWKRTQQRQTDSRLALLKKLDVQRQGTVNISRIFLDHPIQGAPRQYSQVKYRLRHPASAVEDTDIRGFLDGSVKYPFNQGTSYHMRVGRRMSGPYNNVFELKRSLVRWALPEIPQAAIVSDTKLRFWIEGFSSNSPLSRSDLKSKPLHLFVYGLKSDWVAGQGGVNRDSFSQAAQGEANWNESRVGISVWDSPGALLPGEGRPIGMQTIIEDDGLIVITSPQLNQFLVKNIFDSQELNILLKLGDEEENRWGTEIGILSSEFGSRQDIRSKRPRLDFVLSLPYENRKQNWHFTLEAGAEDIMAVARHEGEHVMISTHFEKERHGESAITLAEPNIYVRGGRDDEEGYGEWERLDNPVIRRWDWSQIKISLRPYSISLGMNFSLSLLETWVKPGPRDKQRPELVLIAPSGQIHKVEGEPQGLHYIMTFRPDEPGLWRYGWSFLPRPQSPPNSHQGEGLFYVATPVGEEEGTALRAYADYLIQALAHKISADKYDQYRINAFTRWAARFAAQGKAEKSLSEQLVRQVRAEVNSTLFRFVEYFNSLI